MESEQKNTNEEEKKQLMFQVKEENAQNAQKETNNTSNVNAAAMKFKRNNISHLTVKMNLNNPKLKVNIHEQNTNSTSIGSTTTNKTKENSGHSEEQNKLKRMKRTEDSLRDLWDHIKCTNF